MYYIALLVLAVFLFALIYKKNSKVAFTLFLLMLVMPLYHISYNFYYKKSPLDNTLKVSSFDFQSPWLKIKSDAIVDGIDVHLMASFATAIKAVLEFVENKNIENKNIDILIGGIYKEYLENDSNFVLSESYGQETMLLLGSYHIYANIFEQNPQNLAKILKGKTLGTLKSKRHKIVLKQMGLIDKVDIKYYNTLFQLLEDYVNNKVNVVLLSSCMLKNITDSNLKDYLITFYKHTPNNLYIAFNKNSNSFSRNIKYFNAMIGQRNKLIICD